MRKQLGCQKILISAKDSTDLISKSKFIIKGNCTQKKIRNELIKIKLGNTVLVITEENKILTKSD